MNHRTYTEAHLTLLGWRPTSEGRAGATDGRVAVYAYTVANLPDIIVDSTKRPVHPLKLLDMWFMSDELFWPIVHHIREHWA